MIRYLFILNLSIFSTANAVDLCSDINFCQIKKITYEKKGWVTNYSKEFDIKHLCYLKHDSSHTMSFEPELGLQLQIFPSKPESLDPIDKKPTLVMDLFTYKLTYVIASGKTHLESSSIGFSHRLNPKGQSFINISCIKKTTDPVAQL